MTNSNQYTISSLIERLKQEDPEVQLAFGFSGPHSYRGDYEQLAVEAESLTSIGEMIGVLQDSLGETFDGYKGGEFVMDENTLVYLCDWGVPVGTPVDEKLLKAMLDSRI